MVAAQYKCRTPTVESIVPVSIKEINQHQAQYEYPQETKLDKNGIRRHDQQVWIPGEGNDVMLRNAIEAHCGVQGHSAINVTIETTYRTC